MNLAILQARMSSSRLPGKVMATILDKPMIMHQIERLQRSSTIDDLLVATSTESSDDELADYLVRSNVEVFRGPLDDVIGRFVLASQDRKPEFVIRLTADCPLTDPVVIDQLVELARDTSAEYTSNCFPRTFPRGLDAEVIKWSTLVSVNELDLTVFEREHVGVRMYSHPEFYKQSNLERQEDLSTLRWTVDTPRDFEFVKFVYENLYAENTNFSTDDILELIARNPTKSNIEREL